MTWLKVDPSKVEQHRKADRGELIPERWSNTAGNTYMKLHVQRIDPNGRAAMRRRLSRDARDGEKEEERGRKVDPTKDEQHRRSPVAES